MTEIFGNREMVSIGVAAVMESVVWWKSMSPFPTPQADSAPLNPRGGKCLLDSFCQYSLYSWYKPGTGREFIHCCCFVLGCIWKLTFVSPEFHPRENHSNWAIPQAHGDRIWEWQKNRIPILLQASGVVLLHPVVAKGCMMGSRWFQFNLKRQVFTENLSYAW